LTKKESLALPQISISSRSKFVVSAGDQVTITGTNFRPTMTLAISGMKVSEVNVKSDVQASFTAPQDVGFGQANLTAEQDGISQTISLFYSGNSDYPIITKSDDEVCSGETFYNSEGLLRTGTKSCSGPDLSTLTPDKLQAGFTVAGVTGTLAYPANCAVDGEVGCVTTAAVKAAVVAGLASKVLSGQTVASVSGAVANCASPISQNCYATGTYFASTMCSSNGADSCVIDNGTNYRAAATASLIAGNIKRGVNIGGITGNFPSATSPLPRYSDTGATAAETGTDMPDLTNFQTQLKTNGTFEFWDSSGMRNTGAGDADITNSNVITGAQFENLSITGSAPVISNCTDAGQTNCKTTSTYRSTKNFRNTARTGLFDNATSPSFVGLDFGDSIDDYNANVVGLPNENPWGAVYAAHSSYWLPGGLDVSVSGVCNDISDQCVYEDKITGLRWSESISTLNWWDAILGCDSLTFATHSDWRLPTQKEMQQAAIHGIRSVEGPNFIADLDDGFWSATTDSNSPSQAWYIHIGHGTTWGNPKSNTKPFICVRDP
jgi:hypothetical protein